MRGIRNSVSVLETINMKKGDSVKEKHAGCVLRVARYALRVAGCGLRGTCCGVRVAGYGVRIETALPFGAFC